MTTHDPRALAEGFALAAAAHEDPAGERAQPGLDAELARALRGVARELSQLDRRARRERVRELLALRDRPARAQGTRNARALALLATRVPREIGRAWLSAAPPPRVGYAPDPRLTALLARLAREPSRAGGGDGGGS